MSKPGITLEASQRGAAEVRLAGKLGGMSLHHQVFTLAFWPLLEQVLAFFVGLTDLLISGRIGQGAERVAILDAMGLGGYVGWFFNILQGAVATGVMALVSRATGARDHALANRGLGQSLWLGLLAGAGSLAILQAGVPLLIHWVGLTPAASVHADSYLRALSWSGPLSGAMFAVNAALRGSGDTRTPFFAMIAVNLVNMAMSWLFVFGPAPFGGHGVAGIATGTVIGWAAGLCVNIVLIAFNPPDALRWTMKSLLPHLATMQRIIRVGWPQCLEIAGMWLIHSYGIRLISALPTQGSLGAHILAIRVESMSFLPGFAIASAAAALAGQYLGAGSREMATRAVRVAWRSAAALMCVMGGFFIFGRETLINWMAPESAEHLHLASPLLIVSAISQPFFATCIILKTSMRGAGATTTVMRWSFGSMIFFRIVVLGLLQHFGLLTLTGVWIVFTCDLILQAAVFARLHFLGKWLNATV